MRLIDADALRKNAQHAKDISKWDGELLVVGLGHILNAPTISPRPDWTPCAEGKNLPKDGAYYVTLASVAGEERRVETRCLIDGEWVIDGMITPHDCVIAYYPKPEPYNPDHIRDTTKKVDQFREPTKMMED